MSPKSDGPISTIKWEWSNWDFLNAQRQVNITFERILFLQHAQTIACTMYSISNAFKICDGFNLHDFIMENKHITLV